MLNQEQRQQVQELLDRGREQMLRPEIVMGLIMRYLQTQDVDVTIEADVPGGAITIRF